MSIVEQGLRYKIGTVGDLRTPEVPASGESFRFFYLIYCFQIIHLKVELATINKERNQSLVKTRRGNNRVLSTFYLRFNNQRDSSKQTGHNKPGMPGSLSEICSRGHSPDHRLEPFQIRRKKRDSVPTGSFSVMSSNSRK